MPISTQRSKRSRFFASMSFLAYDMLLYLIAPLALLYFFIRGRKEPAYRYGWKQRFGYCDPTPSNQACIWVHAASVGEVNAVAGLLSELASNYPNHRLLVTTMTPTGKERALGLGVEHAYVPLDNAGAVRRFTKRVQPVLTVLVETEIWPNLLHFSALHGEVVIVNASLSDSTCKRLARFPGRPLLARLWAGVSAIAAQTISDKAAFEQLGAASSQVQVLGNIKFDQMLGKNLTDAILTPYHELINHQGFTWLAASTHPSEELLLLEAQQLLKNDSVMVLAPRHPQRLEEVRNICDGLGMAYHLHSSQQVRPSDIRVYIVDTLGELLRFYAISDAAVVAGSFVEAIGGHNILEPAAVGCPIIVGPFMHGFQEIYEQFVAADALVTVEADAGAAAKALQQFVTPEISLAYANRAKQVVDSNQGALQRTAELITVCYPM